MVLDKEASSLKCTPPGNMGNEWQSERNTWRINAIQYKRLIKDSFEPQTSGFWVQHAYTGPLYYLQSVTDSIDILMCTNTHAIRQYNISFRIN